MANLTDKELIALEDQLSTEQVLIKKYRSAAQACTDTVIKTRFDQAASLHQQHYDKLITYLK